MSKGFNLTAELNLRGPTNIRTVVADIRRQVGSVSVNITPTVNRQSIRSVANTIRSQLSNLVCDVRVRANSSSLRSISNDIRRQLSGVTANVNVRVNSTSVRAAASDIRRQLGSINTNVNVRFNNAAVTAYSGRLTALNNNLNQITASATNATAAINSLSAAMRGASAAATSINNASVNLGNIGGAANRTRGDVALATNEIVEFGRQSGLAFRRFSAISTVTGVIYGLTNAISQGVKAFVDFDLQLTRISQVTGDSKDKLGDVANTITNLSTTLGVSSGELTKTTVTLAQAGLTAKDTATALKALALSALAPSFDDMNQTVEGSIALMRQFGIGANQLEMALGSVNAVSAKFAVEASDIITAIQRTGGVFAAASRGVSSGTDALNEFIAVFTSIRATTRESAETIATGLRTIFTRIQRAGTIEALKEFGVTLTDLEGKFVGPYIAVQRLSEGLSRLDPRDLKFSQIVEELGGFRQIGKVLPLIQQFATAQDALKIAQQGQGSLAADAAKGQLALAVQIQKVREEFQALIRSIGDTTSFQAIVRVGLDLASALIKVADATKGVLPLITMFAAFKGISAASQYIGGFGQGIRGGASRRAQDGGRIYAFASGGLVPGSGNTDSVDAKVTPGEYVINKSAVQAYGVNNLHKINRRAVGGKIKDLSQDRYGKSSLKQYYDTAKDFDTYSPPIIKRQNLDKTYEQYTKKATIIWNNANKKYKQDLAQGYTPTKGITPELANEYIKSQTSNLSQNLGYKELREPLTPRKLNKIRGALAEADVKNKYRLGKPLSLQSGIDFYDSANNTYVEVKNQKQIVKDETLQAKALLGFANKYGKKLNNKPDNIPSLKILAIEAPNSDDANRFNVGGSVKAKKIKEVFGTGETAFPRRISNDYAKEQAKADENFKIKMAWDQNPKDERINIDDAKVNEVFQQPFDRAKFIESFKEKINRNTLFTRISEFAKFIGLPKEDLSLALPMQLDFGGKGMSVFAAAQFAKGATGVRPYEGYDLSKSGYGEKQKQEVYGLEKLIEAKQKEIKKITKTPTRTYDDGSFSIDNNAYSKANDELRDLKNRLFKLKDLKHNAEKAALAEQNSIASSTGRGTISFASSVGSQPTAQNTLMYHELTHQLFEGLRTKSADSFTKYRERVTSLFSGDNNDLADAFDTLTANNGYSSADVVYGRSYKSNYLSQMLMNYYRQKQSPFINDDKVSAPVPEDITKNLASLNTKSEGAKRAREYRPINPSVNEALMKGKYAISQQVIDKMEDNGKEEFLTTLVQKAPQLDQNLQGILDSTLTELLAGAGIKRQKYASGGAIQRNLGYIDSDVLADPINAKTVRAEMQRLGITDIHKYKLHLSDRAASLRKSGDLKRLSLVHGVAGSGKSTFVKGGIKAEYSDNATLRKTNRYPILTEADISKSDQIVDSTSIVGPKQKSTLAASDRIVNLSTRLASSKEAVIANRKSRDNTGIGLFGRKPGATRGASLDSGFGEAYIAASEVSGVDPKRVTTYAIGQNFSKQRIGQPTVRSPERTLLDMGNFGPTTAGHLAAADFASKKSGISPQDSVVLVSGDASIDFKNPNDQQTRTAIFPQQSKTGPSRLGMARATFGARGFNVAATPRGTAPGAIPNVFKVGEDSYIVPRGKNDAAIVGDEKDDKVLSKYKDAGYSVITTPRIGGISGTAARDAIMKNDMVGMQKLLSPEGFQYVQQHLETLQKRPQLLDSILARFVNNSSSGRGMSGRLSSVMSQLSSLPARKTKTTPPETSALMDSLRKQRDDLSGQLGRRPGRVLERLELMRSRKFADAGIVSALSGKSASRSDILKVLNLNEAAAAAGILPTDVYEVLGKRNPSGQQEAWQKAIREAYLRKTEQTKQDNQKRIGQLTSKGLAFGAAGMFGAAFPSVQKTLSSPKLKNPVDVYITSGVMDPTEATQLDKTFSSSMAKTSKRAAKRLMVNDILKQVGLGKTINLDFDRTLAFGADKILANPKQPKFAEFSDPTAVQAALQKSRLTLLGKELSKAVAAEPSLLSNLKVITARPAKTLSFIQNWLTSQGLPIPLSQFSGVGGPGISGSQIPALKAALLSKGSVFVDDDRANVREARKKGGVRTYRYGSDGIKKDTNTEATAQGTLFEYLIQSLGGPKANKNSKSIDFPNGLKGAAKYFNIKPNIPTDAKRTLNGPSTVEDNIVNYLSAKGYSIGGSIQKFAAGGTVPALVSNGEAFVPPATARKIGYSTLNKMNRADSNGFSRFADGGISIFKGPGSGTSDSIPTHLPVGGFVIRAAATKALGLSRGGSVQRFALGGTPRAVPNINGMNDTQALAVVGVVDTVTEQLKGLAVVLEELGVSSSESARIVQNGTQATYQQAIRATEADIRRARFAGASAEQIAQAENQLANIRRQAQQDIQTRRTLGGLSGTQLQRIESNAQQEREGLRNTRTAQLRASGMNQNDIDTQLQSESADIDRAAYRRATRRQGINLGASGLQGDDAQRFIRQSMGDPRVLRQMDQQLREQLRNSTAYTSASKAQQRQMMQAVNEEIGTRRQIVNSLARQRGQQTPGGDPSRSNMQGVMGFAFGLQGIGSLIAQQINSNASSSGAATAGAIQGGVTGISTGAMLSSGIRDMLGDRLGPTLTKVLGPLSLVATAAAAVGQAFIDSRNAVIEFEKNLADKRASDAMEKVSKGFDKLSNDIKNLDIQKDITRNLVDSSKNVDASIGIDKNMPKAFWANIIDAATSTDKKASSERSKILERQGVGAYLGTTNIGQYLSGGTNKDAEDRRQQLIGSMIPETAREDSKKYGDVAQGMQKIIEEKLRSGIDLSDILNQPQHEFGQFAKTIAMADQATHAQILSIQSDTNLDNAEKARRINLITTLYAEDKVRKSAKTIDIEKQSKNFDKNINNLSRSLERMFQNMDQSIEKTSFSLRNMSDNMDLMTASLSGQAKTGDIKLRTSNIIQNPRAYGSTEINNARQQASSFFSGERNLVKGLLSVGDKLESSIMSTINKTLTENPAANNEQIGINIEKAINGQIENLQLPPDVANKLGEQVKTALDQVRKRGDEKIDFGDLMEKIPGLSKVIESGRRAQESALKVLEYWQGALNAYSERMNQLTDLQVNTNEKLRRSTEIVINGNMELAKALGKDISVSMVRSARNSSISQRTGGATDINDIGRNIKFFEGRRQNLEASSNAAANRGMSGANDFIKFKNQLVDTNVALRENIEALKSLAESGDVASAALSKVQEAQQKQAGRVGFLEKLVTSTPDEFASLGRAMGRLQNNINGQLNTINNSVGAQKAYNDALDNGATAAEAMQAAQVAFANERKETLGALNELLPFLGNNQQGNNLKANVLESMVKESGIGMNPMIQQVLNALRNPQSDPETQAAMQQYQAAINEQSKANVLLARLNETLAKDIATKSAEALSQALTGAVITFKNSQLDDIAQNVRAIALKGGDTPVVAAGKATGGVIYASTGSAVTFTPRGTDTVPAMLTPGEFVINRQATSKHLPLLESINSGAYSKGGSVRYYSSGGYVSSSFKDEYKDKKRLQYSDKAYADIDDEVIQNITKTGRPTEVYSGWKNFTILQPASNKFLSGLAKSYLNGINGIWSPATDPTEPIAFDDNRNNIVPGAAYGISMASTGGEYKYLKDAAPDLTQSRLGLLIAERKLTSKKIPYDDMASYRDVLSRFTTKIPLGDTWDGEYNNTTLSALTGGNGGLPYNPNLVSSDPIGMVLSQAGMSALRTMPASQVAGVQKIHYVNKFMTGQTEEAMKAAGNATGIYGSVAGEVNPGIGGNLVPVPDSRHIVNIASMDSSLKWMKDDKEITSLKTIQQNNYELLRNTVDDVFGGKINWLKNTGKTSKLISLQQKLERLYDGGSLAEEIDPAERDIIDWTKLSTSQPAGHFNILSNQLDAKLSQRIEDIDKSGDLKDSDSDVMVSVLTAAARARAGAWAQGLPFSLEYNDGVRRKAAKQFPWISNKEPEYFLNNIKELKEKQAKDIASGKNLGFDIQSTGLQDYVAKLPAPLDQMAIKYKAAYLRYTGKLFNLRDEELDDTAPLSDLYIIDPFKDTNDSLNIFKHANFPERSFFTGSKAPYSAADIARRVVVSNPKSVLNYIAGLKNNDPNINDLADQVSAELMLGPSLLKVGASKRPSNMPEQLFYGIDNGTQNIDISEYVVSAAKNASEEFKKLAIEKTEKVNNANVLSDSFSDQDIIPVVKKLAQQSLSVFARKPGIPNGLLYNMFGKAGYFITDAIKAKNIAGMISQSFGSISGRISGTYAKNNKEFEALRDSNILATGASMVFGMLSSGNRTNYIKSFLSSSSSLEDLFRSLGSGQFFNEAASTNQLTNDFTKKMGVDLKGSKKAQIGNDGSITLTEFNEQDIPKNYQDLVNLVLNPYHEFSDRTIRKNIFSKLINDIPNFRATKGIQDPKTGTISERKQTQNPLFGPAAQKKISSSLDSLSMWYGGGKNWLGQDYLNENIPGTTFNDRAQALANNFDNGLYTQASEAHKYLGGLANTGSLPDRAWLMSRGMAKMPEAKPAVKLATGGMVYASSGTYVNFQPRGTDTVPAMLTPGEFVVNRAATQQHLPLLRAINNGTSAYSSGGVVYAAGGFDPSMMTQGAYQATAAKPSFFGNRNPGAFRPTPGRDTYQWIPRLMRQAGAATRSAGTGLYNSFLKPFGTFGNMPNRPDAFISQLAEWHDANKGAMFPASKQGAAYQRIIKPITEYNAAQAAFDANNTRMAKISRLFRIPQIQGMIRNTTSRIQPLTRILNNPLTKRVAVPLGIALDAYATYRLHSEARSLIGESTDNSIREERTRRMSGPVGNNIRDISLQLVAGGERPISVDDHLKDLKPEEASHVRYMGQLQMQLDDARKAKKQKEVDRLEKLMSDERKAAMNQGLYSSNYSIDRLVTATRTETTNSYAVRRAEEKASRIANRQKEETEKEQRIAEANAIVDSGKRIVSTGYNAAVRYGIPIVNSAMSTIGGFNNARAQAKNAQATVLNRTKQANEFLESPVTPDLVSKTERAKQKKQKQLDIIANYEESESRGFTDDKFAEEFKAKYEAAKLEIMRIDNEIIALNQDKEKEFSYEERQSQWDGYAQNQNKIAQNKKVDQARQERRVANEAVKRQAQGLAALNKIARMPTPTDQDKLQRPETFLRWRNSAYKTLEKKFGLTGNQENNIAKLVSAGMSQETAQSIVTPIGSGEAAILSEMFLTSMKTKQLNVNPEDVKALQLTDAQVKQLNNSNRPGFFGDYSADPLVARRDKLLNKEFIKTRKKLFSIQKQAEFASRLNDPVAQLKRQQALQNQLVKQGLVSMTLDGPGNQERLQKLGLDNNASSFIFNQNIGRPVARMNQGGVVYASGGTLIPYQPRGTDTVPAMLTPGEFVVNAKATSTHLPLLQSINKTGGGVIYRADGGNVPFGSISSDSSNIRANQSNLASQQALLGKTDNINKEVQKVSNISNKTYSALPNIKSENSNNFNKLTTINSDTNRQISLTNKKLGDFGNIWGFSSGGVVYAADGTLVNYQPRGTDTVPAMLTPGEFVVNARATTQHLPLLQAINNSKGGDIKGFVDGGVVYAQDGRKIPDSIIGGIKDAEYQIRRNYNDILETNLDIPRDKSASSYQMTPQNNAFTVEQWKKEYNNHRHAAVGDVDLRNPKSVQSANIDLVNKLLKYTSSPEGAQRLIDGASNQFGITNIEYNRSLPKNTGRNFPGTNNTNSIYFGRQDPSLGLYQHEVGHAIQNHMNVDQQQLNNLLSQPEIINFLRDTKGYNTLWAKSGMRQQNAGYSAEQLMADPSEIFTNMIQLMSIADKVGQTKDGTVTKTLYDNAFKAVMKSMGYSKGGVVYAQEGMRIPSLDQITPRDPSIPGYAKTAEERYMDRWRRTHTDLLADQSEGPGMLAAPFHERLSAGLNMLADIGSAKLAGAKGTRGQKFASVKPNSKPGLLSGILGKFKKQQEQSNNTDPISESPTFFHNSRAVFDRPDPNKANFGTYGPGFYGGTDATDGYNRNYGDISYQFKIKGGVDDFPLANQKIGSSAHLERVSRIYEQLKIKPPSNLEDLTFSHFISDIGSKKINQIRDRGINSKLNPLLEPLGISLSDDLSPKQKNRITQQIRKSLVENNIPGLMNTRDMSGNAIPTNLQQMAVYDYDRILFDQPDSKQAVSKNKGGMIYANNGMLIPYQPKGTDIVPAMLTPGEFVINKQATQQNLPLLKAINSGSYEIGGVVSYLSRGGIGGAAGAYGNSTSNKNNNTIDNSLAILSSQFASALTIATKVIQQYNQQLAAAVIPNSVSNNNGSGNAVNLDGLSQFTTIFSKFIGQLEKLNLPPVINMQGTHTVNVVINGGEAFKNMDEGIKQFVISEINSSMSKLSRGTEGAIPTYQV